MTSAQYHVRSKPIFPLHLQIPKQPKYPVGDIEYNGPQGYRPEPYSPSAFHNISSGFSIHNNQRNMNTWPRSFKVHGYGNGGETSSSPSASEGLDTLHPIVPSSESSNLYNDSRAIYEGLARQPIRKRTAQACEKCRNRKTKCSGERPACQRCAARGLVCNYTGGRVRGPSKSRLRGSVSASDIHFAPDNLEMPSLDLLSKTPQRRHVSASLPPSQASSPIRSNLSHPRPVSFNQSDALSPRNLWRDAMTKARGLRQVPSHSVFESMGTVPQCDLTPRPAMNMETFEPDFFIQLLASQSDGNSNQFSDLGNSSGSEPPSATQLHFGFSSASPETTAADVESLASLESLFNLGRAATPINFDSYSSSPASASMSSGSSPSSAVWSADLDRFGAFDPPANDGELGNDSSLNRSCLPSISDLVVTGLEPPATNSPDQSQSLHDYLADLFGGDTCGTIQNGMVTKVNDTEPSVALVSRFMDANQTECAEGTDWDKFTFPAC